MRMNKKHIAIHVMPFVGFAKTKSRRKKEWYKMRQKVMAIAFHSDDTKLFGAITF